jgi:hypothetical protein
VAASHFGKAAVFSRANEQTRAELPARNRKNILHKRLLYRVLRWLLGSTSVGIPDPAVGGTDRVAPYQACVRFVQSRLLVLLLPGS